MLKKFLQCILLLLPLAASSADFKSGTDTAWDYLFKKYTSNGGIKTENIATPKFEIDRSILDTMISSLPEGHKIDDIHPEYFPSPEPEIIVVQDAEVFVTFYSEGAGYRNALGYYTYDGDTNRTRPSSLEEIKKNGVIAFPNTSLEGSGGDLKYGTSISLGNLSKGTKVIFFLVSNGWKGKYTGVRSSDDWIFTSWSPLNKEYNADSTKEVPDHKHVALLWKDVGPGNILLMGFEDILRTHRSCDHDYNDVLFSISSSPMEAISDTTKEETGETGFMVAPEDRDSDEDGVNDAYDSYPEDPERAYNNHYPNKTDKATLVFEDMWPREGDYDMNDLSVAFSIKEVKDAQQKVKDIIFTGNVQSYGAGYSNGFALSLNTPADNIVSAEITMEDGTSYSIMEEIRDDNGNAVVKIFRDAEQYLDHFANVYKDEEFIMSDSFTLKITLEKAASLVEPPYNPFLVVTRNVREEDGNYTLRDDIEVHLPNYAPTSFAPKELFGTMDDTTDLSKGRSYQTGDNKPWALLIPTTFAHPAEQINIKDAYRYYQKWVDSNGEKYADWYIYDRVDSDGQSYGDKEKIIIHP